MADEAGDLRLLGACGAGRCDQTLNCGVEILETRWDRRRSRLLVSEDDLVGGRYDHHLLNIVVVSDVATDVLGSPFGVECNMQVLHRLIPDRIIVDRATHVFLQDLERRTSGSQRGRRRHFVTVARRRPHHERDDHEADQQQGGDGRSDPPHQCRDTVLNGNHGLHFHGRAV